MRAYTHARTQWRFHASEGFHPRGLAPAGTSSQARLTLRSKSPPQFPTPWFLTVFAIKYISEDLKGEWDGRYSGRHSWCAKFPLNWEKPQNSSSLRLLFLQNHLLTATFVLQGLKSNPKLVFDGESHHVSIFQCGKDLSENISIHLQNLLFELHLLFRFLNKFWTFGHSKALHVFPRSGFVTCFPALSTRSVFSRALAPVKFVPAFGLCNIFSRAWQPLCVLPRLTNFVFSRAWYLFHIFPLVALVVLFCLFADASLSVKSPKYLFPASRNTASSLRQGYT